jgi:hypothetical protein
MSHVYRVSKSPDVGEVVDSIPAVEAFAREHGPGRYHVDEHASDPFPGSKTTARAWGDVIHQPDGRIALKPHPWGQQ